MLFVNGALEEILMEPHGLAGMDIGPDGIRTVMARTHFQVARLGAPFRHLPFGQRWRIEGVPETVTPGSPLGFGLDAHVADLVFLFLLATEAVRVVHVLIVRGVDTVLDGTLVVALDV